MQVYLLTSGEYEDYQVWGAFASMEDAERAKLLWGLNEDESTYIEKREVLRIPELLKHDKNPYLVKFDAEQQYPVYISKGWVGISSVEEGYSFLGEVYRFYVYAVDEEDAKKKAISYFHTLSKLLRKEQQEEQWYPVK
jgi:hypothetical protein